MIRDGVTHEILLRLSPLDQYKLVEYITDKHNVFISKDELNNIVMNTWKQYKRKGLSEMRPYVVGESLERVSISQADKDNGSPKEGDMIARNPKDHSDMWLVAEKYFQDNLEEA